MKPVSDPALLAMLENDEQVPYVNPVKQQREVTDPALLAQLEGIEQPQPEPSLWDKTKQFVGNIPQMVKGNATEAIGDVFDPEFEAYTGGGELQRAGAAIKALPSSIWGTDADLAQKSLESVPGSRMSEDANGNPVIETPDGKRFYVNTPGLDYNDTFRLGANMASYGPGGVVANAVKPLVGRAVTMGGMSAATNLTGQMAGRDEIDPVEVGMAGLGGAGGEFIGPGYAAFKQSIQKLSGREPAQAEVISLMRRNLNLGQQVPDQEVLKMADEVVGGASPQSMAGQAQGFQYTQGQKTGDFGMLSKEELLRSSQGQAGQMMRNVDTANNANLDNILANIRNKYVPDSAGTGSPSQMVEGVQGAVQKQAGALEKRVSDAYGAVGKSARVPMANVKQLPDRVRTALREMAVDPALTPATANVVARIESMANQPNVTALSLKAIDGQRKVINSAFGSAANPADRKALTMLKREYDDWMDESFTNSLIKGDPKDIESLRTAQSLRAEFGKRFEGRGTGDVDTFIDDLVQGGKTPDELVNVIYGAGQVSKPAAARFVQRLKVAVGDSPEAMNALKVAHLMKLTTGRNGERLGMQAIRNNILQQEREGGFLIKELYGTGEWSQMKQLAGSLEPLIPKGQFARTSGTAERIARFGGTLAQLPWAQTAITAAMRPAEYYKAAKALSAIKRPAQKYLAAPVAGAELGTQLSQ